MVAGLALRGALSLYFSSIASDPFSYQSRWALFRAIFFVLFFSYHGYLPPTCRTPRIFLTTFMKVFFLLPHPCGRFTIGNPALLFHPLFSLHDLFSPSLILVLISPNSAPVRCTARPSPGPSRALDLLICVTGQKVFASVLSAF